MKYIIVVFKLTNFQKKKKKMKPNNLFVRRNKNHLFVLLETWTKQVKNGNTIKNMYQ